MQTVQVLVALVAVLAATVAYKFFDTIYGCWRNSRLLHSYPGPSYSFVLGVIPQFAGKTPITRVMQAWADEYGPIYHIRLLTAHILVVTDPRVATELLHMPKIMDKNRQALVTLDTLTSRHGELPSLVTNSTNDVYWKAIRKGVAPAFSPTNIRKGFAHVLSTTDRLLALLEHGRSNAPLDMDNLLLRQSLDVIGLVGFEEDMGATSSLDSNSQASNCLAVTVPAMLEVERRFGDPFRARKFWRKDVRQGEQSLWGYQDMVRGLLRRVQSGQPPAPHTLAAHLLGVKDPHTGGALSEDRLASEIGIFFLAGFETTGHSGAWLLYLVSQHPQVEANICQELDEQGLLVTPKRPHPRKVTFEDLSKLTYLDMAIKESMRLFPVVGSGTTRRNLERDMWIGGGKLFVPKGVLVWVPMHAVQNVAANWDEPDQFQPERWSQPGAQYSQKPGLFPPSEPPLQQQQPGGVEGDGKQVDDLGLDLSKQGKRWFPFSDGPRNCVGQALAKMNMATTLAQLYSHYSFQLAEEMGGPAGVMAAEHVMLTVSPSKGMKMHVMPRKT
ncbi:hypothetical protein ABBQ32_000104 [Trebouxia sp. C0010 RCD-2024]